MGWEFVKRVFESVQLTTVMLRSSTNSILLEQQWELKERESGVGQAVLYDKRKGSFVRS